MAKLNESLAHHMGEKKDAVAWFGVGPAEVALGELDHHVRDRSPFEQLRGPKKWSQAGSAKASPPELQTRRAQSQNLEL